MRLESSLVREIILTIEEADDPITVCFAIAPHSGTTIEYHVRKLIGAGFVGETTTVAAGDICDLAWAELTYEGHLFAEKLRDETWWKTLLARTRGPAAAVSIELLKKWVEEL